MRVAVAFDHRGVKLREPCIEAIAALGHEVVDLGTDDASVRIDYPDKARELGEAIRTRRGRARRPRLRLGRRRLGRGLQAARDPRRDLPRHVLRAPGRRARRHERALPRLGDRRRRARRELVRAFLGATFVGGERYVRRLDARSRKWREHMPKTRLQELSDHGQSVWIDYLSRDILESGKLAEMMERDAVVGVTSNPTIFQKAIAAGDAYDEQLKVAARDRGRSEGDLPRALGRGREGRAASCCGRSTTRGGGRDGYVSLEVDPEIAYDRERTFEEAKRLHEWIDGPNLYVKIPATKPGVGAIEDSIAEGRNINVTLIFSLAALRGGRRGVHPRARAARRGGGDPSTVRSVASFFVSRVDTEADKRLERGRPHRSCRASSRSRTRSSRTSTTSEVFSGERWEASPRRARPRSAASGRRRRRRTRTTAT